MKNKILIAILSCCMVWGVVGCTNDSLNETSTFEGDLISKEIDEYFEEEPDTVVINEEDITKTKKVSEYELDTYTGDTDINLVSDAFYEVLLPYCYHIPQINYDSDAIRQLNQQIYDEMYEPYHNCSTIPPENRSYASTNPVSYKWGKKDSFISLFLIPHANQFGGQWFSVYNVNLDSGKVLEDKEVYAMYGYNESDYADKLREYVIDSCGLRDNEYVQDMIYDCSFDELCEEYSVSDIAPFIYEDGRLYVALQFDRYFHIYDIEKDQIAEFEIDAFQCNGDHGRMYSSYVPYGGDHFEKKYEKDDEISMLSYLDMVSIEGTLAVYDYCYSLNNHGSMYILELDEPLLCRNNNSEIYEVTEIKLSYLDRSDDEVKALEGKRITVTGKVFWFDGQDMQLGSLEVYELTY